MKRINRTNIYKSGRITIFEDEYGNDDRKLKKAVIDHPNAGGILPVLPDGRILLVKQYRVAVNNSLLEIPAGAVEKDDIDCKSCAIRELFEETGYEVEACEHLIDAYPWAAYTNQKISIYVGFGVRMRTQKYKDAELIQNYIFSQAELLRKIQSGEVIDSKTVIAFLTYCQKYLKV